MRAMRARTALIFTAAATLVVPAAAQPRAQETLVINVISVSVKGTPTRKDKPPKGASRGDTVTFRDSLLNAAAQFGKPKGVKVGTDGGTMTFTSRTSAEFKGLATLPGGTVTLNGKVAAAPDKKSIVIPITGGTGRFKSAKGFLLVGPGDRRALNTYSLTFPGGPVA